MIDSNIFNTNVGAQPQQVQQTNEFRPNPKKGQNGVFKATVRFIPALEDPLNKSIVSKYTCFMTHPTTKQKRSIDCPFSIGAQDKLRDTFFYLRNSESSILKENMQHFSSHRQFASVVQVLTCESDPSLVNKFLVWRFGTKVNEKLQLESNPPQGSPRYPFNLMEGRPFSVVVKEVGGFPNYDGCSFFDWAINESGMRVQVNGQWVVVTPQVIQSPEGHQAIVSYMEQNIPDLSKYEYHPWTSEEATFVDECISVYTNEQLSISAARNSLGTTSAPIGAQPMQSQVTAQPVAQPFAQQVIPQGQPMVNQPMVNQPMPNMPQMGFTAPTQMPAMDVNPQAVNPSDPRGFNPSGLPTDVNSLLGNAPVQNTPVGSVPPIGMALEDVLNGQMM